MSQCSNYIEKRSKNKWLWHAGINFNTRQSSGYCKTHKLAKKTLLKEINILRKQEQQGLIDTYNSKNWLVKLFTTKPEGV
jgi:hypothetical protein